MVATRSSALALNLGDELQRRRSSSPAAVLPFTSPLFTPLPRGADLSSVSGQRLIQQMLAPVCREEKEKEEGENNNNLNTELQTTTLTLFSVKRGEKRRKKKNTEDDLSRLCRVVVTL